MCEWMCVSEHRCVNMCVTEWSMVYVNVSTGICERLCMCWVCVCICVCKCRCLHVGLSISE